jgi:hypothetical protein
LNPRKKDLFLDHINGGGSFLYLMEMTSFIWAYTRKIGYSFGRAKNKMI